MLGRKETVERLLDEDPSLIEARGAHGIPLMPHAAMGNNLELAEMLFERGATAGMSHALGNAIMHGDVSMARWILGTGQADLLWKDYEGKSLMAIARGTGNREMVDLMREHGLK
jgi:ankyrin repeat protein